MTATRTPRLGLLLSMALTLALAPATTGLAQGTQTKPGMTPKAKAKEKAKAVEPAPGPIDLNSATSEELMTLPGVGEATAKKIVEGRPYKAMADLGAAGITLATIEKIKPLAVVTPLPEAVDVNRGDLKAIEALPGVGPTLAKEIIAGRPYEGYDDLAKLKGVGPSKLEGLRGRLKFGTAAAPAEEKKAETVKVPPVEEKKKARAKSADEAKKTTTATKAVAVAPTGPINLNKASKEDLQTLPGIGPVYSQAIIDARPFATIEDIMKIKGIKEVEFGKIKDRITVK